MNPNNYTGINAVIVGRVGADPENPAYDKEGAKGFQEIRVAVDQGYKKDDQWVETGTLWVTYTAKSADLAGVGKGDKIRLDDVKFTARDFQRKDGSTGQAFEARFGTLTVLESKQTETAEAPF